MINGFFLNLVVSLLVGFLVGVERQISQNYTQKDVGVRDFLIISLLSFISANMLPFGEVGFFAVFVLISASSLLGFWFYNQKFSDKKVAGFTTFFAIPTVFLLSGLSSFGVEAWKVLVLLGVLILTLMLKEEWNTFINTIKDREVIDFILFLIILFVVTPLIPNALAWDFGFYKLEAVFVWKIVVIISILSFFAHFFTKYSRGKRLIILSSFLGGVVSSLGTVYLATKGAKKNGLVFNNAYVIFISSGIGSLLRDLAILYYMLPFKIFELVVVPFAISVFLLITVMFFSIKKIDYRDNVKFTDRAMPIKTIIEFVLAFFFIIIVSAFVKFYLPETFLYLSSFLSGIISSSAAVSASTSLFMQGLIEAPVLFISFVFAILGSLTVRSIVMLRHYSSNFGNILLVFLLLVLGMSFGTYLAVLQI